MLRSSATSYFHADGLGSITSLSNSAGTIANTYTYDSYGNLTASTGTLVNPFQYTARESDPETGLYYYRARYYDPQAGRFLSEDRARFQGGNNFYPYVKNSPLVWIDPSGDNLCYSVTPNGMTEKPCADPGHGMDCIYVPTGVSCAQAIPPGPPTGPALSDAGYPKWGPNCFCNPLNLSIEAHKITNEAFGQTIRQGTAAGATSGILSGIEVGLHVIGLATAGEVVGVVDLGLLGYDAYEFWKRDKETQEKLKRLYEACDH
jgi:RHS repeat-associated protein